MGSTTEMAFGGNAVEAMASDDQMVDTAVEAADGDGDGCLDDQELRVLNPAFLERIGLPAASATELLRLFDKNADRKLDEGERQHVVARLLPDIVTAVEVEQRRQDFAAAGYLQAELDALKGTMRKNFKSYQEGQQAGERSGLYNFQQFALIKEGQGYEAAVSAVEEQFAERRMQLDRQFAMRMEVAEAEWGAGVRRAGTALTPKPTPAILDLRHTLHHLSEQKRFAEAAEVQATIDSLETAQLQRFGGAQPAYAARQRAALKAEYAKAADALSRRRQAALAKLADGHSKERARVSNGNAIYKARLEHAHTKSTQPAAVVGARPVRVPQVPTLPKLQAALILGSEPARTAGSDGAFALSLPPLTRKPSNWRRPLNSHASYLADPMWTRKGLVATNAPSTCRLAAA